MKTKRKKKKKRKEKTKLIGNTITSTKVSFPEFQLRFFKNLKRDERESRIMRLDRKLIGLQRYEEMKVFLNKKQHHVSTRESRLKTL